ncbi:class I SAM-dependent methyltransferase [Allokutzneria sp. A3M-2-11 16]|uniref:class I SAM-dependent methyltransferase n=1 Tax=Allokutzneria sp. A3M-2-11 16 TaxID=2962043 RepID=UPI0020B6FDB1|nr:class I SAM-dependent methyltransferase [Allokutzneria sp. A3M-2-11 16]MCP3798345.1 class I SAM-dependent methyltransferase [Allokutzneria sp. A3M-2-11 16]
MDRISIELGNVQETLLSTLYARALETRKRNGIVRDPKADEMVRRIDYDFTKFDGSPTLIPSVLRTLILDEWVRGFLSAHPQGTVVEIGAGLNSRFERVDNGRTHWLDLDLPDSMELRKRFFTESDRRRMVAASVLDDSWYGVVRELPPPYFFVSEGVLLYLREEDVRRALGQLARGFPGCRIAFDTAGRWMVEHQGDEMFRKKIDAQYAWHCDDPGVVQRWDIGLRLAESRTLLQLPRGLRSRLPLLPRMAIAGIRAFYGRKARVYLLNLFESQPSLRASNR